MSTIYYESTLGGIFNISHKYRYCVSRWVPNRRVISCLRYLIALIVVIEYLLIKIYFIWSIFYLVLEVMGLTSSLAHLSGVP